MITVRQRIVTIDGIQRVVAEEESDTVIRWKQQDAGDWELSYDKDTKMPLPDISLKKPLIEKVIKKHAKKVAKKKAKEVILQPPLVNFTCVAKDHEIECGGEKCTAHIVTRQIHVIKSDAMNQLTICKAHEKYFNDQDVKEWYRFVKKKFPQHFTYVKQQIVFVMEQLQAYLDIVNG